jgi:hypothetical protein
MDEAKKVVAHWEKMVNDLGQQREFWKVARQYAEEKL